MIMMGRNAPQKLPITTREVAIKLKNGGVTRIVFEEQISKGRFNDVWKVRFRGEVAILKFVDAKCGNHSDSSKKVELINTEVEAYRKLTCLQGTCIPKFRDVGWIGDILYGFITSYEGESVSGPLSEAEKDELRRIVGEMHKLGVVHGDLRFPNIVRNNEGKLKLIDFGLSKPC